MAKFTKSVKKVYQNFKSNRANLKKLAATKDLLQIYIRNNEYLRREGHIIRLKNEALDRKIQFLMEEKQSILNENLKLRELLENVINSATVSAQAAGFTATGNEFPTQKSACQHPTNQFFVNTISKPTNNFNPGFQRQSTINTIVMNTIKSELNMPNFTQSICDRILSNFNDKMKEISGQEIENLSFENDEILEKDVAVAAPGVAPMVADDMVPGIEKSANLPKIAENPRLDNINSMTVEKSFFIKEEEETNSEKLSSDSGKHSSTSGEMDFGDLFTGQETGKIKISRNSSLMSSFRNSFRSKSRTRSGKKQVKRSIETAETGGIADLASVFHGKNTETVLNFPAASAKNSSIKKSLSKKFKIRSNKSTVKSIYKPDESLTSLEKSVLEQSRNWTIISKRMESEYVMNKMTGGCKVRFSYAL